MPYPARSIRSRRFARRRVSAYSRSIRRRSLTRAYGSAARTIPASGISGGWRGVAGSTRHVAMRSPSEFPVFAPRWSRAPKSLMKFSDVNVTAYEMSTTGSLTLIPTLIQQGDTLENHVTGNRWMWAQLQVRGIATVKTATTVAGGAWMIVYDRAPRAALPAITDILEAANSTAFINATYRDRFDIVYRANVTLEGNNGAGYTSDSVRSVDVSIRLNRPCTLALAGNPTYNAANIASVVTGALYLVTVGTAPTGTTALELQVGVRAAFYAMGVA